MYMGFDSPFKFIFGMFTLDYFWVIIQIAFGWFWHLDPAEQAVAIADYLFLYN